MLSVFNLVVGLVVGLVLVMRNGRKKIAEDLLRGVLVATVGVGSLLFFVCHVAFADVVAESIGWPAGNPFQTEVAVANLTLATLGIACAFVRGNFWLAAVVAFTVQWWGAAVVHVKDIIVAHNYTPNNAGATLWFDVILPMVLIGMFVAHRRAAAAAAHQ
jgi:hypothetical protein